MKLTSKYSFNLSALIPKNGMTIFGLSTCSAFLLFLGQVVSLETSEDRIEDFLELEKNHVTYEISGPNLISYTEGDTRYSFNYRTNYVVLSSKIDDTWEVTRTDNFNEFASPAMIDELRAVGCEISGNYKQEISEFNTFFFLTSKINNQLDEAIDSQESFFNEYCPG